MIRQHSRNTEPKKMTITIFGTTEIKQKNLEVKMKHFAIKSKQKIL
jgi:hypothetical protein